MRKDLKVPESTTAISKGQHWKRNAILQIQQVSNQAQALTAKKTKSTKSSRNLLQRASSCKRQKASPLTLHLAAHPLLQAVEARAEVAVQAVDLAARALAPTRRCAVDALKRALVARKSQLMRRWRSRRSQRGPSHRDRLIATPNVGPDPGLTPKANTEDSQPGHPSIREDVTRLTVVNDQYHLHHREAHHHPYQ